jgi:hypothetical protein
MALSLWNVGDRGRQAAGALSGTSAIFDPKGAVAIVQSAQEFYYFIIRLQWVTRWALAHRYYKMLIAADRR